MFLDSQQSQIVVFEVKSDNTTTYNVGGLHCKQMCIYCLHGFGVVAEKKHYTASYVLVAM